MTRKRRYRHWSHVPASVAYPTTRKAIERFVAQMERRVSDGEHEIADALETVLDKMWGFDSLASALADANVDLFDEDGKPLFKAKERRALEKRLADIERTVERYEENSNIQDDVNTLHSFVIGVISEWSPSGS